MEFNTNEKSFKIIGLRVEKYKKQTCSGHNCDFIYGEEIADKHTLLLLDNDNNKFELSLHEEEGECGSGWCVASWAYMNIEKVDNFRGYTHKPKTNLNICLNINSRIEDYFCEAFDYSYYGGDEYYPTGYYKVNMDLFISNARFKDKMPVWIFTGESATGKSFIAEHINGLTKFETDSVDELPSVIDAQIIVLGNKHTYTLDDVKSRIPEHCEVHIVTFK